MQYYIPLSGTAPGLLDYGPGKFEKQLRFLFEKMSKQETFFFVQGLEQMLVSGNAIVE